MVRSGRADGGFLGSARKKARSLLLAAMMPGALFGQVAVTTYHYDNSRTGTNPNETILKTSNVNVSTFGRLFSRAVDGQIYAQPLYVPNVAIPGKGVHNVVYVVTMNDSAYAFDADFPALSAPLWQVSMGTAMPVSACCEPRDVQPRLGILSTPVIDVSAGALYLVAQTYESGNAVFRLHGLDLATGADKVPPAVIQGSTPGSSPDSASGTLTFVPMKHWQRPGLLLMNGKLYIAFGSHQDSPSYHGWLFSYDSTTLQQLKVLCFSPGTNGEEGGVWQGGVGLAGDAAGNIYVETGNGPLDANTGGSNYGDAVVKINGSTLAVLDYFSPSTQSADQMNDWDLGSSGPLLVPGTSLGLAGGKDGKMYVFDTTTGHLGQFNPITDQIVQEWQATTTYNGGAAGGFWGGNYIYYNSTMYGFGERDSLKAFAFNGSQFNTIPTSQTAFTVPSGISNDPAMSISANGTAAGTGIVWVSYSTASGFQNGSPFPGILRALDASNLTTELWNSTQNSARDSLGNWAKWSPPIVANGKVYVGTFDNVLKVYGLLPSAPGGSLLGVGDSSSAGANLTAEGGVDWVHWGDTSLNRKAGVSPQLSDYTVAGTGPVTPFSDDLRPLSWTDGTPTTTGFNNTNGVYISGAGQGLSFTAPADTTPRTVVVHVGGYFSAGTLTAHLSDASAADYTDTTAVVNDKYDRNYTLTYNAASVGQTLTVTWSISSGSGNVTLEAAAIEGQSIVASGGTPQGSAVNTAFTTALQAAVKNSGGNPVSGAMVTFTAPGSGASGTFGTSATASVATNASGVATAPTFTANSQTGGYTVTASVAGVVTPASFSLNNTGSSGLGSLQGTGNSATTAVNLTAEGNADWIHWGENSLNRKASVLPQLSNYAVVGSGTVFTYNNDPRPVSWTDSTLTVSSTNNYNGVYIGGIGQGFSFTVPADTTPRTLVVHVGGYASGGTLTAHLSDGSAFDFTDAPAAARGQYDRNYTLAYCAALAGQTLKVTWRMTSGTGNVTLNAAGLQGVSGTRSMVASAGTPQNAAVNTAFATALQATVKDGGGNPVSGATVTFTAPASGATGAFGASATANVATNASGVATAPTFTANSQAGGYTVTATVAGVATPANFSLTNTGVGAAGGGSLTGTWTSASTAVNLTTEGSVDWVHWGDASLNRKAGVTPLLSTYTVVGAGSVLTYNDDPRSLSWTGGAPTATGSNKRNGVYIRNVGQGFSFTAPADTTVRTLVVHVGGWKSGGTLTAQLSDGSALDFTDAPVLVSGQYDRNYTLTYQAGAAGQTLTVTWKMTSGTGNVTLNGAALH